MYKVAALYKFQSIASPQEIQVLIRGSLKELNITGTILVGGEGLNGTISGSPDAIDKAITFLKSVDGFSTLDAKYSTSSENPFIRLKVKLKKEIVTIGDMTVDPNKVVGEYIEPNDWNALITDEDTILIDTRNDYEYSIGTFKNSINPKTTKFRDFPDWVESAGFTNDDKKSKKIAMFCTGGIRCEKASSFMKNNGFNDVYHLKGGILKYLENIPE
ncbi:rhodanese-like domain-containing protein, partial [Gammaproteobacteria bacterium]|nr:rhodanese-like domain-containing protein [Gammaproteobacteria bacterium]